MLTPDQEFVEKCWREFTERAKACDNYRDATDEFLLEDDKHRVIMEYVLKLYAHKAAGDRANDAEWAWRFGLAAAFGVIAIGFLVEHSISGAASDARFFFINILAAAVAYLAPWWRKYLRR